MDTDALTAGTLQNLRATRPYPAVSLTMPTHRRAPDNTQDAVRLRNLVTEAGNRLDADPRVTREARDAVKAQLDRAATDVDQRRALESLVVLADADEYQIWQLPRTAPERVVISDSYLTRNLVAAKAGARLFWVLSFSAEHAALWSGTAEGLREVHGHGFPLSPRHVDFDPERQARSGGAPSIYTNEDTRNFFRTVDEKLRGVLAADPRPLFLIGLPQALSLLDDVGGGARSAACEVAKGTTAETTAAELARELEPALDDWRKQGTAAVRDRLDTARGAKTFAGGLDEVWAAAREGRVALVAVEEHFQRTVKVTEGHLVAVDPADIEPGDEGIREDIVDELIETVLDNGGEVAFVADDSLAEHGRLAAVLRF
ncbi:chemotaxis protein [Streptomyces sp. NBC_01754]|uniref:baeRF3 domain-containing protein n=1 Tax=Streptomyces sp. NBC_01754 TaxID=2975930 RepID=UPI002DDB507E|nr:chemotaxis protein [Streptomyces sp. NBC_01754]WSC91034.1 chemotaxis protein [Streptomyces sp. NBC_01754]